MTSDNSVSGEMLAVEQRHREAAAVLRCKTLDLKPVSRGPSEIREGKRDDWASVQAFARFERDHMPARSTPSVDEEMLEALKRIAADAAVGLDELPDWDQPNGWRRIAVERIEIARAAIKRAESAAS